MDVTGFRGIRVLLQNLILGFLGYARTGIVNTLISYYKLSFMCADCIVFFSAD